MSNVKERVEEFWIANSCNARVAADYNKFMGAVDQHGAHGVCKLFPNVDEVVAHAFLVDARRRDGERILCIRVCREESGRTVRDALSTSARHLFYEPMLGT